MAVHIAGTGGRVGLGLPHAADARRQCGNAGCAVELDDFGSAGKRLERLDEEAFHAGAHPEHRPRGIERARIFGAQGIVVRRGRAVDDEHGRAHSRHDPGDQRIDRLDARHHGGRIGQGRLGEGPGQGGQGEGQVFEAHEDNDVIKPA
jgi:hypothetical protein